MIPEDIKSLVGYRLQQAQESLNEAQTLIQARQSPRSIVNRSYYAMFYATLGLLQSVQKQASKHTGVLGLFDRDFIVTGIFAKEMSKDYHRAFDLRQTSDYDLTPSIDQETSIDLYHKSLRFVQTIKTYLTEQGTL